MVQIIANGIQQANFHSMISAFYVVEMKNNTALIQ